MNIRFELEYDIDPQDVVSLFPEEWELFKADRGDDPVGFLDETLDELGFDLVRNHFPDYVDYYIL